MRLRSYKKRERDKKQGNMIVTRQHLLRQLADLLVSLEHSHPLRVAITGIDASGKTTLADELALVVAQHSRPVIRASIDSFQRLRKVRYQRGPDSPEGYYEDGFDYAMVRSVLLAPLGPQGNRRYQCAVFDVGTDTPLPTCEEEAPTNAILLVDGVFLLHPELEPLWDYCIFVHTDFEVALQRAVERDRLRLGSREIAQKKYLQRYFPGQRLYFQRVSPQKQADVIVQNNDPVHPYLVFRGDC